MSGRRGGAGPGSSRPGRSAAQRSKTCHVLSSRARQFLNPLQESLRWRIKTVMYATAQRRGQKRAEEDRRAWGGGERVGDEAPAQGKGQLRGPKREGWDGNHARLLQRAS